MVGGVLLVISLESQKALSWHAVVPSPQRDENTAFLFSFPLAESIAKAFFRLFLWKFKEKASTVFMLQPFKKASAVFYGTAQITRGFWGKYSEADAIQKAGDVPEPGCSGGGRRLGRIACFCRAGSEGPSQWRPRASFPSAGYAFFPARLPFSTAMTGRSAGRCLHHCVRPQPSPYLYVRSVRSRVPPSHMSKGTAVRPPLFVSTNCIHARR